MIRPKQLREPPGKPAARQHRSTGTMIRLKNVREPSTPADGARILVERLWPRGVKKSELRMDAWLKEAAPSTELRKWFNHDPARWSEFQRRYRAELESNRDAWQPILEASRTGTVTLLFSSRDAEHNNVVALKAFVEKKIRR